MPDFDETDLEILQLLLANARRPYRDIADAVGLSAPAVSDRIARLREVGLIERFTVDVDRSQLRSGTPVLIELEMAGGGSDAISARSALLDAGAVEHVFTTAAGDLTVYASVSDTDVRTWLEATVEADAVDGVDVTLLSRADWSPDLGGTEFALACAECGNTVDSEGTATRIDGQLYQFCCQSCEARFAERYADLQAGAE